MCDHRARRMWVAICLALALGAIPIGISTSHAVTAPAKQTVHADTGWPVAKQLKSKST